MPGLLLYNQGRVALEIVRAFREIEYSVVPMILLACASAASRAMAMTGPTASRPSLM